MQMPEVTNPSEYKSSIFNIDVPHEISHVECLYLKGIYFVFGIFTTEHFNQPNSLRLGMRSNYQFTLRSTILASKQQIFVELGENLKTMSFIYLKNI